VEVQFASKPDDERYLNKRTEMWWALSEWLKQGGRIPNDQRLKLDLCAPRYDHRNAAGKMALESKDKIKERGLPSTDYGDAWALTFAYPVYPAQEQGIYPPGATAQERFNALLEAKYRREEARQDTYDPLDMSKWNNPVEDWGR